MLNLKIEFLTLLLCTTVSGKKEKIRRGRNPFCFQECTVYNMKMLPTACLYAPCDPNSMYCNTPAEPKPLRQSERVLLMEKHNNFRNTLPTLVGHPASNMNTLTYSLELEFAAQCHANSGCEQRDPCNLTPRFHKYVGQNMFKALKTAVTEDQLIAHAIDTWAGLVQNISLESIDSFSGNSWEEESAQLMWADTEYVGCGRVMTQMYVILYCNYGPGGSVQGHPIYKRGGNCTQCPFSRFCHYHYKALCGEGFKLDWNEPFTLGRTLAIYPRYHVLCLIVLLYKMIIYVQNVIFLE